MQIIGGRFRGKKLATPEGADIVRPTSSRAREAIFNILLHSFQDYDFSLTGARTADLFSGTGALGLEALSRGAQHVTFVEKAVPALVALKRNVRSMRLEKETRILATDALQLPKATSPFSLILMDPPYAHAVTSTVLQDLAIKGWVTAGSVVVSETPAGVEQCSATGFQVLTERRYGKAMARFFLYRPE